MGESLEEPEGSGCGTVIVITVMVALPMTVLWAISPAALVLAVWVVGWGSVIWSAKRVPRTPDPAPPPPSERGSEQEPQVTILRDTTHPNRWIVARPSRWMTEEIYKEIEK